MTTTAHSSLPLLFTPIKLRGLEIRNRIMASPMCQYLSEDGGPNDWHLMHLGRLAIGGCGIVFGEETAVEPNGRKTYSCAGMYDTKHVGAYRRLTNVIKKMEQCPLFNWGTLAVKGPAMVLSKAGGHSNSRTPSMGKLPGKSWPLRHITVPLVLFSQKKWILMT